MDNTQAVVIAIKFAKLQEAITTIQDENINFKEEIFKLNSRIAELESDLEDLREKVWDNP